MPKEWKENSKITWINYSANEFLRATLTSLLCPGIIHSEAIPVPTKLETCPLRVTQASFSLKCKQRLMFNCRQKRKPWECQRAEQKMHKERDFRVRSYTQLTMSYYSQLEKNKINCSIWNKWNEYGRCDSLFSW